MKSGYWLLAFMLLSGGVRAVSDYGTKLPRSAVAMPMIPAGVSRSMTPDAALRAGMEKLLTFLNSEQGVSPDALATFLNAEIAPFFDFAYMARSAAGRMFDRLDGRQRDALTARIKQSFLLKMTEKLGGYEQQQVRFLPPRPGNSPNTAQVGAVILNPGRYPARLDFRLYRDVENWLVYDVAANGQSAIVHYRNQLLQDARRHRMQQMQRMAPPPNVARPPAVYR